MRGDFALCLAPAILAACLHVELCFKYSEVTTMSPGALDPGSLQRHSVSAPRDFLGELLSSSFPCAIVDRRGRLLKVSPGLSCLMDGAPLEYRFDISLIPREPPFDGRGDTSPDLRYGVYRRESGELSPIMAQVFGPCDDEQSSFAAFFDGQPFRDADVSRLSAAPYPIVRTDIDGRISLVNASAEKLFGIGADDLLGRRFSALFNTDDQETVSDAVARASEEPCAPREINVAFADRQGASRHPVHISLLADRIAGGRILGAIAVMETRKIDLARNEIKQIAIEKADWRDRLKKVLDVVRTFIAFDGATFGIYTKEVDLFKWLYVEPQENRSWPGHWVELRESIKQWIASGETWAGDLQEFVRDHPYLSEDPIVRRHLEWGHHAFVTLPVMGTHGLTSSLSLVSKAKDAYGRAELDLLRKLDLERVTLMFENDAAEERRAFCERVRKQISDARSLQRAAEILVENLHGFFEWSNASIITIDERSQEFRLLRQKSDPDCALHPDFRQPLSQGMLGATLKAARSAATSEAEALLIEDTRVKPPKYDYIATNDKLLSAMNYPIRLSGEWRWIINVESASTNAFHGADAEALRELSLALQDELNRLYDAELNSVLLDKMPEGVVVVSPNGSIVRLNRTAVERFFDRKNVSGRLADYAADETTREIFRGEVSETGRRLKLSNGAGRERAAMATRVDLSEEFQSSVWFLTDLDNLDWNVEYRYLRAVVNDVAQQTRGSLLLASAVMQKLARQFRGRPEFVSIEGAVGEALAELAKSDITFERLAGALSTLKEPIRERKRLNLGALMKSIVSGLPARDQVRIELTIASKSCCIVGDAHRLRAALRSIVGYLLRHRTDDDVATKMVGVTLTRAAGACILSMKITGTPQFPGSVEGPADRLDRSIFCGHMDAELGLEVAEAVVKAHDGQLVTSIAEPPPAAGVGFMIAGFDLEFPSREGRRRHA
jgi:PAS domain S-box-containing protein